MYDAVVAAAIVASSAYVPQLALVPVPPSTLHSSWPFTWFPGVPAVALYPLVQARLAPLPAALVDRPVAGGIQPPA